MPLDINCWEDVIRRRLETVSMAADLLRGPAGIGEDVPSEVRDILRRAAKSCRAVGLPHAMRVIPQVPKAVEVIADAMLEAGGPSSHTAFAAVEAPLLAAYKLKDVRKLIYKRLNSISDMLVPPKAPPVSRPMGITLKALAMAVKGPNESKGFVLLPDVLQIEGGGMLSVEKKAAIRERDRCICVYCGEPDATTVDHWIPLCWGGTNDEVNLVCACEVCNGLKGNLPPTKFYEEYGADLTFA